jgi:hypothetical protein
MPEGLPAGVTGNMYSGADTVVVRLCNVTGAAVEIPPALAFNVRIIRGF